MVAPSPYPEFTDEEWEAFCLMIDEDGISQEAYVCYNAATLIQSVFRGWSTRNKLAVATTQKSNISPTPFKSDNNFAPLRCPMPSS